MSVRSRGSLLAGTATLAGLLWAGIGCHSSPSDHDSFSMRASSASSTAGAFAPAANSTYRSAYQAPPAVGSAPASGAAALQPVPTAQGPGNREVIASTFQPVQRVSAEQTVPAPDLQGDPSIAAISGGRLVSRSPNGSPMPVGSPNLNGNSAANPGNGPVLDGGPAAPPAENIVLPQPRPLASAGPAMAMAMADGAMPPHPLYPPYPPHVPREFEKMALPPYVVEPPDILLIQGSDRITLRLQRIEGQHLVAPDGTINLGIYGKIRVVGMTLDQVGDAVAARLLELMPGLMRNVHKVDKDGKETPAFEDPKEWRTSFSSIELLKKEMQVDVLAYNSKYYYVITDGGGYGQQVYPILITGNETVLDALAKVNGLPAVANKKRVWVARATRAGQPPKILPVDWLSVTQCGSSATNYQVFPGDRVYVDSDKWFKTDAWLARRFSPVQRILGVTLLGASTVNAIKLGTSSGSGLGGVGLFR